MNAPHPRPGGGFNSPMGNFGDEHLDANAMQQAMKQQALSQQAATQTGPMPTAGTSALPTSPQGDSAQSTGGDSLVDIVLTQPFADVATTIAEALGLEKLLGLVSGADTPEEKAKKQQTLQRYNQLTEEQQSVAKAKYQERLQQEQQARAEAEQRHQMEAQQSHDVVVPTGKSDGARDGGGSGKQRAVTKLQQDRKSLGGPQSAG